MRPLWRMGSSFPSLKTRNFAQRMPDVQQVAARKAGLLHKRTCA
jgi:hypothetical protein